jgi:hypothetical protein
VLLSSVVSFFPEDRPFCPQIFRFRVLFTGSFDLHACFAWLGLGAFTSRKSAIDFLAFEPRLSSSELDFSDNFFTTLQNSPPVVVETPLLEIASQDQWAFSGGGLSGEGGGLARNLYYIQRGVDHLQRALSVSLPARHSPYEETSSVQQPHTAACVWDACAFVTNIANLPPRNSFIYPSLTAERSNLSDWQTRVEGQIGKDAISWVTRWPYWAAVDGNSKTAFRSVKCELSLWILLML